MGRGGGSLFASCRQHIIREAIARISGVPLFREMRGKEKHSQTYGYVHTYVSSAPKVN